MKYEQPKPEHVIDRRDLRPTWCRGIGKPVAPEALPKLLKTFDKQRWERCVRAMEIHIAHGDEEQAVATLHHYFKEERPKTATLDSHLIAVLPDRIASTLEWAGVKTLREAMKLDDEQLLAIPQFGESALDVLRKTIVEVANGHMLELRADDLDDPAKVAQSAEHF